MENFVLSIPQGMYVCIDIKDFNKQTNQKQIDIIFTDNLFTCSCFFIKDIYNNFVIFAHIDASTNTIDQENGLFTILEKKQQKYGLSDEDIEIYFEHGVNHPDPNPYGNDDLVSFDYKCYVESYLKEKNKNYTIYEIGPSMQETMIQQYHNNENHAGFKLIYNSSHKSLNSDIYRRYAVFNIINKKFIYDYGYFNDFQKSYLTSTSYKQIMKRDDIETERLLFDECNVGALSNYCLCGKYIRYIKKIIKVRLNEYNEKHNEYDKEIERLFTQKDWIFPPMCILNGNTGDIDKIGIENQQVEKQISAYSKSIWSIINSTEIKNLKQLLQKNLLEEYLNIQFNEKYNKISRKNNYFLKQLKKEKADIILAVLNNTENQISKQQGTNLLSENNWQLIWQYITSEQIDDIQWDLETSSLKEKMPSSIPSSISNGKQSLLLTSQNQIKLVKNKTEYKENNSMQTKQPSAMINVSEPDASYKQTQSVQNTNHYNKQQQLLSEPPESLHQIPSSEQKSISFTDDLMQSSQQKTESSIPSSISNGKQSLSSQNQIELARDKTECKESNFVQPEQSNTTANKSEPYTPQSQTQSVQNTDSSFNKKQTSTLQKPESLPSTMKLSLRKLGSLKNETKQLRPYRPSDQPRSIEIKTENQIQSFGHHRFNHSQMPCRLVSEAPYPLSKTEDVLKTANSRDKSVINRLPFVHHPIKSFQQNQQQKPKPIENKKGTVSYAKISLINARKIYKPQAQLNQTNNIHSLQPLKPILKPIRISKIAISQVKAQTASLERDKQIQRSSSTFNPHHQ